MSNHRIILLSGRPLGANVELFEFDFAFNGRGGRGRTHTNGFGDRYTTAILLPCVLYYSILIVCISQDNLGIMNI